MPSFGFTDDQLALAQAARDFARKEIAPVAGKLDEAAEFPGEICDKAWAAGLMNCEVPNATAGSA